MVGDTWHFTHGVSDYPASEGWTASLNLVGPASVTAITGTTATDGTSYDFTATAATTAAYTAGAYTWSLFVTKSSERHLAATGQVALIANAAALSGDNRSHAVAMLALIETELKARVTGATTSGGMGSIESYSIGGRAIHKIPTPDLYTLRNKYRWEVWREKNPGSFGVPVGVRFDRAPV